MVFAISCVFHFIIFSTLFRKPSTNDLSPNICTSVPKSNLKLKNNLWGTKQSDTRFYTFINSNYYYEY